MSRRGQGSGKTVRNLRAGAQLQSFALRQTPLQPFKHKRTNQDIVIECADADPKRKSALRRQVFFSVFV